MVLKVRHSSCVRVKHTLEVIDLSSLHSYMVFLGMVQIPAGLLSQKCSFHKNCLFELFSFFLLRVDIFLFSIERKYIYKYEYINLYTSDDSASE